MTESAKDSGHYPKKPETGMSVQIVKLIDDWKMVFPDVVD